MMIDAITAARPKDLSRLLLSNYKTKLFYIFHVAGTPFNFYTIFAKSHLYPVPNLKAGFLDQSRLSATLYVV
jgi:hypothetical protein